MKSQHSSGRSRIEWAGSLPVSFERNHGQAAAEAAFVGRFRGYTALTSSSGIVVHFSPPSTAPVLSLRLIGTRDRPAWEGARRLRGTVNYFIGADPSRWRRNVPLFAEVCWRDAWPGVTAVCRATSRRELELDFVVAPGADARCVRLSIEGSGSPRVARSGDLILHSGESEIRLLRPFLYQEQRDGERIAVEGGYSVDESGAVAFATESWDTQHALVIDPVLVYSTYLGGSAADSIHAIAVDGAGQAYVAGVTSSLDFPVDNAFQPAHGGGSGEAFVTKLDPSGTELVYSTYLGGRGSDGCNGIALDAQGNAYLTGRTSSANFPVLNAFQPALAGSSNAFIAKLNATGDDLVFSTYLGGGDTDEGNAIAVDATGAAYVAGRTESDDFPTQAPLQGGLAGLSDCFVAKLAPDGQALVFSTFLGGSGADHGDSIAVDAQGAVYVGGYTESADLAVTANAVQPVFGGQADAFVARLTPAGDAFEYLTYLGGSGEEASDGGCLVAVSGRETVVVTSTFSDDFPTINALQPVRPGDRDVAVAKLASDGASFVFSTYLGGPLEEEVHGVALDAYGNIVIAGFAHAGFPLVNPIQHADGGSGAGFVSMLSGDGGVLLFSTLLGGSDTDLSAGVALDPQGRIYVGGWTHSDDFPTTTAAFQPELGAPRDGFIAKLTGRPVYPYEYSALVVSGIQEDAASRRLARGAYATTVNIHNPNSNSVTFFKKLALTYPPSEQLPGDILPLGTDRLGPDETLKSDGDEIASRLFPDGLPAPAIQGFLVVQCRHPLDVTGVYTTARLDEAGAVSEHSSLHVEQVRERVRNSDLSIEKAGLLAGRLEVEPGLFLAAVLYDITVMNHGPFLAEEITITDLLRAENSLCYVLETIPPLVQPNGLFTINYQTYVESELTFVIPELPVAETAQLAFWVLALYTDVLGPARLINRATAFHALFDPSPQNNAWRTTTELWP